MHSLCYFSMSQLQACGLNGSAKAGGDLLHNVGQLTADRRYNFQLIGIPGR